MDETGSRPAAADTSVAAAGRPPPLDRSNARENVGGHDDYPELYVRWFQYATFQPTMRAHGSRKANEV